MSITVNVGQQQYFLWDLHSAVGTPSSLAGIVTGGGPETDYPTKRFRGIQLKESDRPMMTTPKARVKVYATSDAKPLFENALRSTALPVIKFDMGSPQMMHAYDNAKINSVSFGFSSQDEGFNAEFEMYALNDTVTFPGTSLVMGTTVSDVPTFYNLVVSVGATDIGITKFEGKINNNLRFVNTASSKSSGSLRMPTGLVEGYEDHEVTIEGTMPIGTLDPTADTPSTQALVATVTFPNPGAGPTNIVFTYSGLSLDQPSFRQDFIADGIVFFKAKLIGKPGALVIS